jgi:hypothetical protein
MGTLVGVHAVDLPLKWDKLTDYMSRVLDSEPVVGLPDA